MIGLHKVALLLSLLLGSAGLSASTVLLRVDRKTQKGPDTVMTFGGTAAFSTSVGKPAVSPITVVWLLDAFDQTELEKARNDLTLMTKRFAGRMLRLVVVRSAQVETLGPFSGPARLEQALANIQLQAAAIDDHMQASRPAPEVVLDALLQNVQTLGAQWSPTILVGRMPELPAPVLSYAVAVLTRTLAAQRLRLFVESSNDQAWDTLCASTGGAFFADMEELQREIDERTQAFLEVTWTPARPPAGFVLYPATIADDKSAAMLTATDIADQGTALPSIHSYSVQQAQIKDAAQLFHAPFSEATLNDVRERLLRAADTNPMDPELLRLEALLCEQSRTFTEGVKAAVLLSLVRPADGASYLMLGHMQLLASNYEEAERALNRAAQLGSAPQQLAEDRARIHLGRKDDAGALPYLQAALTADAKRQDLWFVQGHAAEQAHQPELAVVSYEKGLALGGVHISESAALLQLFLSGHQQGRAHGFALHTIESLPAEMEPRAAFAQALEDAQMPDEALRAWRGVIAVRNDVELAHVRVARLLLNAGHASESVDAATVDLAQFPKCADLYLVKADGLRQLGMEYEARGTLEDGAQASGSVAVLAHFAGVQDSYGFGAAEAYAQLEQASEAGSPQQLAALERGCFVALRDGDLKKARAFAAKLRTEGREGCRALISEDRKIAHDLLVPGGRDALAFVAYASKGVPPDKFLAEFAKTILANGCGGACRDNEFRRRIQRYFETVSQLEAMGIRKGDTVSIQLSLKDKQDQKHTHEFLRLLGIDLHNQNGTVKLEMGAGQSRGKKQEVLSALALDEVGLEQGFESGQTYTVEIVDEPVAMYPDARFWQDSFPAQFRSGFLNSMLQSPQLAHLYVAISAIDRRTLHFLFDQGRLRDLSEQSIEVLAAYGSCFAVQGSSATVPGGARAVALWAQMAGVSPDIPGAFYRALLQPANSTLLAYFYELSQLDPAHQAFVTANLERLHRLYFLFQNMPGSQNAGRMFTRDTSLAELLQSVPLDTGGHLAFPGSPEVWSVAKGRDADTAKIAKLMKKVSRTAPPDVEDAVLLRLAETRYKAKSVRRTELDNFLSVSHVDAHRTEPLDPESALLLAQHYADYWPAYTYFADISAINLDGFRGFFGMMDHIAQQPVREQNLELGELHSLLEWISILRWRNLISPQEASRLFNEICRRLGSGEEAGPRARAVLDLARTVLRDCDKDAPTHLDEVLRACLVGSGSSEAARGRAKEYDLVMDAQKVPSLAGLLSIVDALSELETKSAAGVPSAAVAQKIVQIASALPSVEIPKHTAVRANEREMMELYSPGQVQKRAGELSQNAQKRKPNPKSARKLGNDLLEAMEPQLMIALAGPIYAVFLRSSDLAVGEDPLLLRKHRYFDFLNDERRHTPMQESEFIKRNESVGSYFVGGFAQFGLAAGSAAASSWRRGGNGGEWMVAAQIAGIRSTPWDLLTESDQRFVSLEILGAKEWIVAAAQNPKAFEALSEQTTGLLSLSRRASLLSAVQERDWPEVWESISLPDLFMLGSKLAKSGKDFSDSQLWSELRRVSASNDGSRISHFGRIPYQVLGCAHPHVAYDAPYEQYERRLPVDMAERTADLKLFLAYRDDSMGVPPPHGGHIAESIAANVFASSQITDDRDWRSVLAAYSKIDDKQIMQALAQ